MNWEIKLKANNDYTKWLRKKIKNQKNKDKVKKKYMVNWDRMMKLKKNYKKPMQKVFLKKNQNKFRVNSKNLKG